MQIYKYLENKLVFGFIFSNCKAHKKNNSSPHYTLQSVTDHLCVTSQLTYISNALQTPEFSDLYRYLCGEECL